MLRFQSSHFLVRRLSTAVALAAALLGVSLCSAAPAHAANYFGSISLKGAGSTYLAGSPIVARAGTSGQTLTYGVKVYNYGSTESQFVLYLSQSGLNADVGLYEGSLLRRVATTSEGYVTAPIAPQTSITYTLKIKAYDANVSYRHTAVSVLLTARDGVVLESGSARFEMKAPPTGTSNADLTARQGNQAFVGSRWETQYTSSPYLDYGDTTKYTVKQAVNAGAPHRLRTYMPVAGPCQTFTVKEGTLDVSAAVRAGTYYTKVLSPGQSVSLTVTFTKPRTAGCGRQFLTVTMGAEGESFTSSVILVAG